MIGENAQGKTNLMESIYLSVLGKSFRASRDEEMIRWGCSYSRIEIDYSDQIDRHQILFMIKGDSQRENFRNGQPCKKKDVVGTVKAVFFCPEDLALVKGAPQNRRRFLDLFLSQIDRNYYRALLKYSRILLQRNSFLKKICERKCRETLLDIWDEQLADIAELIVQKRREIVKDLSLIANKRYSRIAGGAEDFSAHYFVSSPNEKDKEQRDNDYGQWFRHILKQTRQMDIFRGMTQIGPHRDDLQLFIDQHEGRIFSSQGQQRSVVLALKLAEIEMIHHHTGEEPVLLLDDVMSELDIKRRKNLLSEIDGKRQTFISGTDTTNEIMQLKRNEYIVDDGTIRKRVER